MTIRLSSFVHIRQLNKKSNRKTDVNYYSVVRKKKKINKTVCTYRFVNLGHRL